MLMKSPYEKVLDDLYKDLLAAQLFKDWKDADRIQRAITSLEKGEGKVAKDLEDLWYYKGSIR